jgi:site-specific recombinase XerD
MKIENLFQAVTEAVRGFGLAESTIRNSYEGLGINTIRKHYKETGADDCNKEITAAIVKKVREMCAKGEISSNRRQAVEKVASMMDEYMETGGISHRVRKHGSKNILSSPYYRDVLSRYADVETSNALRTPTSVECERILLRHFFVWLESANVSTLSDVTLVQTSGFLTHFAQVNPRSVGKMISTMKKLHDFVVRNNIGSANFTPALTSRPSPRRKLRPMLTITQANAILSSIDTNTPLGKRDYAIMMIAKHLGVRSGDILKLKQRDICWEKYELTFRQNKTGVDLTLPLPIIVGNAIAEYILTARPKTFDEHIFVRHIAPYVKLDGATNIFRRYDPDGRFEYGTGFHSFRRNVASQLLNMGIAADTVKGILGHMQIDSLKPYARISESKLESCALGLKGFETTQEELR